MATELGIRPPLLYRWAQLGASNRTRAAGASYPPRRSVPELEAEIRRLQAENANLLEQREILKISLGTPLPSAAQRYARSNRLSG